MTAQFKNAVKKKGGTMKFLSFVRANYGNARYLSLLAKLGLSGVGKALTGATGGISGGISLALDAWTLYEISDIIADALQEPKSLTKDSIDTTPINTTNVSPI